MDQRITSIIYGSLYILAIPFILILIDAFICRQIGSKKNEYLSYKISSKLRESIKFRIEALSSLLCCILLVYVAQNTLPYKQFYTVGAILLLVTLNDKILGAMFGAFLFITGLVGELAIRFGLEYAYFIENVSNIILVYGAKLIALILSLFITKKLYEEMNFSRMIQLLLITIVVVDYVFSGHIIALDLNNLSYVEQIIYLGKFLANITIVALCAILVAKTQRRSNNIINIK